MSTQTAKLDVTALVNCVARLSEGLDTYTRNDNSRVLRDAKYLRDQLLARQP